MPPSSTTWSLLPITKIHLHLFCEGHKYCILSLYQPHLHPISMWKTITRIFQISIFEFNSKLIVFHHIMETPNHPLPLTFYSFVPCIVIHTSYLVYYKQPYSNLCIAPLSLLSILDKRIIKWAHVFPWGGRILLISDSGSNEQYKYWDFVFVCQVY